MRRTPKRNAEWREAKQAFQPTVEEAEPSHRGVDPAVYAAVVARDQMCRGKDLLPGACQGRPDPHHVWRKGQGGPDHEDNLILLCRFHHDYVHRRVEFALALGFLSHSWDGIEGARAAARLRRGNWP